MGLEFNICQTTNFFLFGWKSDIDENGSLNYYTTQKIIKTYYKNGDSARATYRDLRGDYGLHNRPIMWRNLKRL